MKILHLHPSLQCGGIEAMVTGLANEMAETQDVTVCSIFEPQESHQFWPRLSKKINKRSLHKLTPGFSISEIFKIRKEIKNGNYDIVQLHGFMFYYFLSIITLHNKTKFVYTIHSDANEENVGWDGKLWRLKKWLFRKGWVHPVTLSEISKQAFTNLYHCDSTAITNGINPPAPSGEQKEAVDKYRLTPNTKVFLNAARIHFHKNQVTLVKAFKRILDEGNDAVLLIAGPRQDEEIFSELQKYFSDRIIYLGEIKNTPEWFAESDAMILSSSFEGLPVTLLEAMAVGCIPVTSPVGGIPDVVTDNIDGILANSCSEEDMYQAILRFLAMTPEQAEKMKENGIKTFRDKFTIQATVGKYLDTYKKLLKETK